MPEERIDKPWYGTPWALLIAAVIVVVVVWVWWWWAPTTTVVLVRHAERAGSGANANLTPDGLDRAQELAASLADAHVAAVYVTEFCRTALTADPSALQVGVPLHVKEYSGGAPGLGSCDPGVQSATVSLATQGVWQEELADRIRSEHAGRLVLVVGHSNTTPDLLESLTGESACPGVFPLDGDGDCVIPEDEFDHVFVVEVGRFGSARWMHFLYGEASP